jgi:hypothetical protein
MGGMFAGEGEVRESGESGESGDTELGDGFEGISVSGGKSVGSRVGEELSEGSGGLGEGDGEGEGEGRDGLETVEANDEGETEAQRESEEIIAL